MRQISRVTPISRGLVLYRGLGGVRLPESFYHADQCGHRAFVEWGFMSTTSDRSVAVQYTGVAKGSAFPTLLMIQAAAVDHGGDIGKIPIPSICRKPEHELGIYICQTTTS